MAKAKVSEIEIKKTIYPGQADYFDLDLTERFLLGKDYEILANERFISRGTVAYRVNITLRNLLALRNIKLEEKQIKNCRSYKDFWLNMIKEYRIEQANKNPFGMHSMIVTYFRMLTYAEKIRLINELESQL